MCYVTATELKNNLSLYLEKADAEDVYVTKNNKVIGISADSAINAIYEDYKDFEDELIIQAAKEELLDAVVTSNIKDFENRGIPVFTPQSIVNQSSY